MRILRPQGEKLTLDDKEYNLIFSIDVIDILQEKHDKPILDIVHAVFEGKEAYSTLVSIVTELINADCRKRNMEEVTDDYIKEFIDNVNSVKLSSIVLKTFSGGNPTGDDEDPN